MYAIKAMPILAVLGLAFVTPGQVWAQQNVAVNQREQLLISSANFFQRPEVRAALKEGQQQRQDLLEKARVYVRQGRLDDAISQYKSVSQFIIDIPNAPDAYSQVRPPMSEREEWADVLEKMGRTDEAIGLYRQIVYQSDFIKRMTKATDTVESSATKKNPNKLLPLDENTQIWATNNTYLLARYAQLLVTSGQYDEALIVYQKSVNAFYPDESDQGLIETLKAVKDYLDLGRFKSAVYVLLAHAEVGVDAHFGYQEVMEVPVWQAAKTYVQQAIHIKSDFAPAYLTAAQIDINFDIEHRAANKEIIRNNLDKAEQFARNESLRSSIKKMRLYVP